MSENIFLTIDTTDVGSNGIEQEPIRIITTNEAYNLLPPNPGTINTADNEAYNVVAYDGEGEADEALTTQRNEAYNLVSHPGRMRTMNEAYNLLASNPGTINTADNEAYNVVAYDGEAESDDALTTQRNEAYNLVSHPGRMRTAEPEYIAMD